MQPDNTTVTGQTILERKVVHVPDVEQEPRYTFAAAYRASLGIRTYLGVPTLRDGDTFTFDEIRDCWRMPDLGMFAHSKRQDSRPYSYWRQSQAIKSGDFI
jgi:hypothetical protein